MQAIELIPDTNIFIEFAYFTDVDWPKLAGADSVVLLLALPTLKELDEHKAGINQRRRDRATKVLARIRELTQNFKAEGTARPNVIIRLLGVRARREDFGVDLDPASPDDQLLAIIKRWQQDSQTSVRLVTGDTVMQAKALLLGVQILIMPEELRLPPSPSPEAIRLRRVEEELEALKTQLPKPVLRFKLNGESTDSPNIELRRPGAPREEDFVRQLEPLAKRLHETVTSLRTPRRPGGFADLLYRQPSGEEIAKFEAQIEPYLHSYKEYLSALLQWETIMGATVHWVMAIQNQGTRSCERTYLTFRFPDEVTVIGEPPGEPDPPKEPSPPSTLQPWAQLSQVLSAGDILPRLHIPRLFGQSRPRPRIRRGESAIVEFPPLDVVPGQTTELDPVWVKSSENAQLRELLVSYEIHAATLPTPVKNSLVVHIRYRLVEPWATIRERNPNGRSSR